MNPGALDILRSPIKPCDNEINVSNIFEITENMYHVRPLVFVLIMLSHERRITEDVITIFGRQKFFPIQSERVGTADMRRFFERQTPV